MANPSKSTVLIAEAGVNHNGSLEIAERLVAAAAEAGADVVKFQTFRANSLVTRAAPKAGYQRLTTDADESQFEMIRRLELDEAAHRHLIAACEAHGVEFMSTPFDLESVALLAHTFDVPRLKCASGELTNGPLLLALARTAKPLIVSTGMSTLGEVEAALGVLAFGTTNPDGRPSEAAFRRAYASVEGQAALRDKVVLLHCTTEYPAPFDEVNLRAMDTLACAFGLPVGYSDHTPGIAIAIAAVARGAVVVEKHFTLDVTMEGPDHRASLEPDAFAEMARAIRAVEVALGTGLKQPAQSELPNLDVARKSLVASRAIARGEVFTEANLGVKRPGTGISPMRTWALLGRAATRSYAPDDRIDE
jgi:N-acetylneuraminate synthase